MYRRSNGVRIGVIVFASEAGKRGGAIGRIFETRL